MIASRSGAQQPALMWSTYAGNTARFIHPSRLAECFDGLLLPEGIEHLRNSQRIGRNMRRLIREHFLLPALPDDLTLEEPDLQLLLLPAEDLAGFELRCGAMFLANALAQIIQSAAVHKLREALGQDVYALALANRHLAAPAEPAADPDILLAAMRRDGQACVSSWRKSMPDVIDQWFGLKYAPGVAVEQAHKGDHNKRAIAIVRHPSNATADMAAA